MLSCALIYLHNSGKFFHIVCMEIMWGWEQVFGNLLTKVTPVMDWSRDCSSQLHFCGATEGLSGGSWHYIQGLQTSHMYWICKSHTGRVIGFPPLSYFWPIASLILKGIGFHFWFWGRSRPRFAQLFVWFGKRRRRKFLSIVFHRWNVIHLRDGIKLVWSWGRCWVGIV